MIVIVGKVQVRRDPQANLPGAPVSTSPLVFSDSLDIGEFGYATDTSRLFIGCDPAIGSANYQRTTFPYQNIEVLTEASPTNQTLFNQFVRDQNRISYFVPTILQANSTGPLTYSEYDGGLMNPTRLPGQTISASLEYHSFSITNGDGTFAGTYEPVKAGVLRILGSVSASNISDNDNVVGATVEASALTFSVSTQQQDGDGYYFTVTATNNTATPIFIFLRRVLVQATGSPALLAPLPITD